MLAKQTVCARSVAPARASRARNVAVQAAAKPKLYYFDAPARAEATRLMYTVTKTPFEDFKFTREQWPELKAKMPFGQVPALEVDGKILAQSGAIERYVARTTGLYPTDPWEASKVDEIAFFMDEFLTALAPTFTIKDPEEQNKARQALLEGTLKDKMTRLNARLEAVGPNGFLVGSKLTYADILVYTWLSNLISGFFRLPGDLYKPYPAICAFHKRIASIPEIKAYYNDIKEGPRMAFKPEATA